MTQPLGCQPVQSPPPWYKQFWPWALILLPTSAVLACAVTIYLAISTQDGVVVDDYYKEGKAINLSKARDENAQARGLAAQLLRGDQEAVRVLFNQTVDEEPLVLSFSHATQDQRDTQVVLVRTSERTFDAPLPALPVGKWYVQLAPKDGDWRLRAVAPNASFTTLSLAPGQ